MKKVVIKQEYKKDTLKIAYAIIEGVRAAYNKDLSPSEKTARMIYEQIEGSRLDNIREAIEYLEEDEYEAFVKPNMHKPERKDIKRLGRRLLNQLTRLVDNDPRDGEEPTEAYDEVKGEDIVNKTKSKIETHDVDVDKYCPLKSGNVSEKYIQFSINDDGEIVEGVPQKLESRKMGFLEETSINISNATNDVKEVAKGFFRGLKTLNPFSR